MVELAARQLSPRVLHWLQTFKGARALHLFDRSLNLVSSAGAVIAVVDPSIGPGPINLVLGAPYTFAANIPLEAEIAVRNGDIQLHDLQIGLAGVEIWEPVPVWRSVRSVQRLRLTRSIRKELSQARVQPALNFNPPPDPIDDRHLKAFAGELAGLGPGLTPSGDDILLGFMHALYTRYPVKQARTAAQTIANEAADQTTQLSAALLKAAAEGEAGAPWHCLVTGSHVGESDLRRAVRGILAAGHSSGADALAGFLAGLSG